MKKVGIQRLAQLILILIGIGCFAYVGRMLFQLNQLSSNQQLPEDAYDMQTTKPSTRFYTIGENSNLKSFLIQNQDLFEYVNTTKERLISDIENKFIYIRVSSDSCGPCESVEKRVVKETASLQDDNFITITVFQKYPFPRSDGYERELNSEIINGFIERNNITNPVIIDKNATFVTAFNISAVPIILFSDYNGDFVYGEVGATPNYSTIAELIQKHDSKD